MLIQIDKLKRQPRQIEVNEVAKNFPVLAELENQGGTSFDENICGTLRATWAGDIIEVSGRLTTAATMSCARCLAPVSTSIEVELLLCYSSKSEIDNSDSEEVELRSEELGLISYSDKEIDLRPDLEQEIIMSLPQQMLCGSACKGLCPVCGVNQNTSQCGCEKPVFHAGLTALKDFKVE